LNFETEDLTLKSFDELIELVNIIKYICLKVDKELLNLIQDKEWAVYIYWDYIEKRKIQKQ